MCKMVCVCLCVCVCERERSVFILTRMRSSEVPVGVFSGMLMLYRAWLKIGRLSFSLIRSMKTRAKPTWSAMDSLAKSCMDKKEDRCH